MTTIACKGGQMAADTQCTGDYVLRMQKIYKLPDGGIVGLGGVTGRAYAGVAWMLAGEVGDPPKMKGGALLILRPDGSIWVADDEWPPFPIMDKQAAIGSGSMIAIEAMSNGATAAEAVKRAAKIDPYTSEPVQQLSLEVKKPVRRNKDGTMNKTDVRRVVRKVMRDRKAQ